MLAWHETYAKQSDIDNEDSDKDDDEEDMFNLDEEFSDEEKAQEDGEEDDDKDSKDDLDSKSDADQEKAQGSSKDLPLSASLKKSISDIDQQFSWIKKKRNTKKYLTQDFDIKSEFKRNNSNEHDERDSSKFGSVAQFWDVQLTNMRMQIFPCWPPQCPSPSIIPL